MLPDDTVARLRTWTASYNAITALWLFGSRARGEAWSGSHWDFALELAPKDGETDWAYANAANCREDWTAALAAIVDGEVDLTVFRDPDLYERFDPRIGGVRLWSCGAPGTLLDLSRLDQ